MNDEDLLRQLSTTENSPQVGDLARRLTKALDAAADWEATAEEIHEMLLEDPPNVEDALVKLADELGYVE